MDIHVQEHQPNNLSIGIMFLIEEKKSDQDQIDTAYSNRSCSDKPLSRFMSAGFVEPMSNAIFSACLDF